MRQLIVFSDVSLDGFMAGPNNDLDFVVNDPKLGDEFTTELRAVADTIIFGRKSFGSWGYWMAAEGDLADWMNSTPKVILSSNQALDVSPWPNSTVADLDQIRKLKESDGQATGGLVALIATVAASACSAPSAEPRPSKHVTAPTRPSQTSSFSNRRKRTHRPPKQLARRFRRPRCKPA